VFTSGVVAFQRLNIEAYPDPAPPLVDIIVQNSGSSAEEMERYMTIPVEIQMAGSPTSPPSAPSPYSGCPISRCSSLTP
jgi:cobalt-zinc-cadmium resistance protein CzcA